MTVAVGVDARGVDALTGVLGDSVASPRIWDEMVAELGPIPTVPHIDPFDDEPWKALPTQDQLQELIDSSVTLQQMLWTLAIKVHGDGEDLPQFMAQQRELAELELAWTREAEHVAGPDSGDGGAVAQDAVVVAAQAEGGGRVVPGGCEDGVAVGGGGETEHHPHVGRTQKVSRRRGPRQAS